MARYTLVRVPIGTALAIGWLFLPTASSSGDPEVRTIRARDACDPTTFNAVLGPSACVAGHHGKLTFSVQIL